MVRLIISEKRLLYIDIIPPSLGLQYSSIPLFSPIRRLYEPEAYTPWYSVSVHRIIFDLARFRPVGLTAGGRARFLKL
jgi:hypothetical protein